ncbi:hypothetical protein QQF64_010546 [Cirrhinus molitorella]|uniref:Uncharacterized protein n=1 Tax=Cirrhinus molitorella TaxID=172907 RepID=A0ABR3M4B3_9TELE
MTEEWVWRLSDLPEASADSQRSRPDTNLSACVRVCVCVSYRRVFIICQHYAAGSRLTPHCLCNYCLFTGPREGQRREQLLVCASGSWRRVASLNWWVWAHCFGGLKREVPLLWRFGRRSGHALQIIRASAGSYSDPRDVRSNV